MAAAASWKAYAEQLSGLLHSRQSNEDLLRTLEALNAFLYPVENLGGEAIEKLLRCILGHKGGTSGQFKVQAAQLTHSLLTYQKISIQEDVTRGLLDFFLSSLATTDPPNELLYASAAILDLGITDENPDSLVDNESKPLCKIALTLCYSVETQRAGLHFLLALCETSKLSKSTYLSIFTALLASLSAHSADAAKSSDPLLLDKLLLSRLRLLHSLLPHLSPPIPSLPLLLSSLKANMALGLPGQQNRTSSSALGMASIQPPLPIPPPHPSPVGARSKPVHSVAGPQERQTHGGKAKGRSRNKTRGKERVGASEAKAGSDESNRHSSDSESSSGASETSLPQWSGHQGEWSKQRKGRSWQQGRGVASSSESEVSDNDGAGSNKLKLVWSKIRHEALSCLAVLFKVLDRHTAFSYWLSFLPDGPRPPNSPPLLLTCVLKDPLPKCRGAAISVLYAMLEGSKSYLAVADDMPTPSQAFTPYSITVGGVVRELHRSILLALAAEPNFTTLTQIIKALGMVVANCPYHQLSEGYIGRVTAALGRLSSHRDVNVQVACLTCYGAIISITPSHPEVEQWLASSAEESTGPPWLFQHCISQLQTQSSLVLQTEALQVLAAMAKFYFPQISHCWQSLKDFYLTHLASWPHRIQQHVLKMLEELCRALSSRPSEEVSAFWEELLMGPLTAVMQDYTEHAPLSSQACDILATMAPQTMANIKPPLRILAVTLPLGLSKAETAPSAVAASSVRVLGVFLSFETFQEDSNFFLDCHSAITHCLGSSAMAVRVQASWALANSLDSLSHHAPSLQPPVLLSLCGAVQATLQDGDRVKCNGVRAAGNFLGQLQEKSVSVCEDLVDKICLLLAKCLNSGSMKTRWNACYACHNAFSNTVFTSRFPAVTSELLSSLCTAVQSCKNFKVRNSAAMALTSAVSSGALGRGDGRGRGDEGTGGLGEVWLALMQALEDSEPCEDFSEFKHAASLKTQLCTGICHLLAGISLDGEPPPVSGTLKDLARKHMSQFLSQAALQSSAEEEGEEEGEKDAQEKKNRRELIERAQSNLESITKKESSNSILNDLLSVFNDLSDQPKPGDL